VASGAGKLQLWGVLVAERKAAQAVIFGKNALYSGRYGRITHEPLAPLED